jgi:hypothetical protein
MPKMKSTLEAEKKTNPQADLITGGIGVKRQINEFAKS